jgi:hypothetical protein
MSDHRKLVEQFMQGVTVGAVDDALLTDDMTFWSVNSGESDKARFAGGIALLARAGNHAIRYDIVSLTREDNRAVAEVASSGTLINGDEIANSHVFIFELRDGRIAKVKEYMNQFVVKEKIAPVMQSLLEN